MSATAVLVIAWCVIAVAVALLLGMLINRNGR